MLGLMSRGKRLLHQKRAPPMASISSKNTRQAFFERAICTRHFKAQLHLGHDLHTTSRISSGHPGCTVSLV